MISYRVGNQVPLDDVIALYRSSGLGVYRPIDDAERMRRMLEHANLVVTAWDGARLVGMSRSLTDFAFCTYLADLAVDAPYQRQGIGRELMRRTQAEAPQAKIFLFAAPEAVPYYPHVGFSEGSGWYLNEFRRVR
jgi:predicted N-acetyltransferase YhbS